MATKGTSAHDQVGKPSAIITICTHKKRVAPPHSSTPVSLPIASQSAVQSAWLERIRTLPADMFASELYAGRGFGLASQAATIAKAELYILSAGLGLLRAGQRVPVYGLTVSAGHAESISNRIIGEFDVGAWFSALLRSPYSHQWTDVFSRTCGRILVALTRPYAMMIGNTLGALPPEALSRLRIFGASLEAVLPASLHPAISPHDCRLDVVLPGTRADFSQRALLHFVRTVVNGDDLQNRDADYAAIDAALGQAIPPKLRRRVRGTNEEILRFIQERSKPHCGVGRLLRVLRDEEGIACEQSRFGRLYRAALEQRSLR